MCGVCLWAQHVCVCLSVVLLEKFQGKPGSKKTRRTPRKRRREQRVDGKIARGKEHRENGGKEREKTRGQNETEM